MAASIDRGVVAGVDTDGWCRWDVASVDIGMSGVDTGVVAGVDSVSWLV